MMARPNHAGAPSATRRVSIYETVALQFLSGPIEIHLSPQGAPEAVVAASHGWPLLLTRDELCIYLGLSWSTISNVCPVPPIDLGANVARYSRTQIDEWIATRPGRGTKAAVAAGNSSTPADVANDVIDRREAALGRVLARAAKGN